MSQFPADVEFPRNAPARAAATFAEPSATDKQVSYLNSLLTSRDTRGTKYEGHLGAPVLTKAQASEAIGELVAMPKLAPEDVKFDKGDPNFRAEEVTADPFTPGYYTVVHEDGSHTTYRLTRQKDDADFMPGKLLVGKLIGKDNEADYLTVGHITSQDHFARVWQAHQDPTNAILRDLDTIQTHRDETGKAYAVVSRNCWRCGHLLTDTGNPFFEIGLGPKCARKLGY